ncbi:MAG: ATP-binding protein [bacterium]|nr:ATP-binding protein [bacterium]
MTTPTFTSSVPGSPAGSTAGTPPATGSTPPAPAFPRWYQTIRDQYMSKSAHQFLLHFNIHDYVLIAGKVQSIRDYLITQLQAKFLVVTYSLSRGIDFPVPDQEGLKDLQSVKGAETLLGFREEAPPGPEGRRHDERDFQNLQSRGRRGLVQPPGEALPAIERALRQDRRRLLVIIEYAEKLAPAGNPDREQLLAVETFQRWAIDPEIARNGHMVMLFAPEHGHVASCVYGANSGTVEVQVPLPSADERKQYLQHLMGQEDFQRLKVAPDLDVDKLAGHTIGFSLRDITNLVRQALATGTSLDEAIITDRKKEIIQLESHGLLQVMETRHGLADIGGLGHVKAFLERQIANIRAYLDLNVESLVSPEARAQLRRAASRVPKGILFAGPPGTGKTILAEALAHGSGLNMVKLQDIRSMWVGESERNLTKVLDLLVALQPVLVFVDEIDQSLGSRGGPSSGGGHDTDKRLFGKILEFMGDNAHRGKVLWVAATNRPDYLDAAMLRRFDRVIPILPPDAGERELILQSLASRMQMRFAPDVDLAGLAEQTEGLTGAGLEVIVRRAMELSLDDLLEVHELADAIADYKPNHDPRTYELQTLYALQATNFYSMMPGQLPEHLERILEDCRQQRSNGPLEAAIANLRGGLGGSLAGGLP